MRFSLLLILCATGLTASQPNVLFIMTDDLNCDIGAYGHPLVQTPNMDRLADEGLVFTNAFCNYPQCGSSRASFMTGLYPEQCGVTRLRRLFRKYVPDALTLPQHFRNHGYTVARVGKIYHYDNPNSIGTNGHDDPQSWDIRINPIGRDKFEEDQIFSLKPGQFGGTLSWLAAEGTDEEQTDGMVATESIKLMRQFKDVGKPFFLAVGFYKPHTPYVAPKKFFEQYDPAEIEVPRIPAGYMETLPEPAVQALRKKKDQVNLPEATKREAMHAYYATISFLDAQVGRVLQALEALELKDNTIILFSSDHGYHMGEHDYFQKTTLFENSDRVPLIISVPGMATKGQTSPALVEMIDFYRTLSELAGLNPPPDYVMGKSMLPLLANPDQPFRQSAITQLFDDHGYTIRTKRYRYTKWLHTDGLQIELYDRLNDSAEMVNLANDPNYNDVQMKLEKIWVARVSEIRQPPRGLQYFPPDPKDNGYNRDEYLAMEKAGQLP